MSGSGFGMYATTTKIRREFIMFGIFIMCSMRVNDIRKTI
jgi:hypothetical protein